MSTLVRFRVRLTDVNRRAWIGVGLFTVGLFLALIAQLAIYNTGQWLGGTLLYIGAFGMLFAAWSHNSSIITLPVKAPWREIPSAAPANPARKLFVLPATLFALIAFASLPNNTFTPLGTVTWVTSLALYFIAFWEGSLSDAVQNLRAILASQSRWVMLALLGIVILGAFFYFYRLDAVPAEMTSDHAEKILDTYDILHGKFSIFFERNTGREPLQFYFNALVVWLKIAPLDMLALKVVGASAGVLSIPGVFLLGRELFDDEVGLLAAFFFAVSIFPVAIARIGLRYPLSPLFVAWTCFFLVRALKRQSRNDFLLAGLLLGIGLNGYSPFRVVVLLAFVWLALWLVLRINVELRQLPQFLLNSALMFGGAALVFVPLLRYISENPGMFAYRMATRLTSLEHPLPADPVQTFISNNWRAFGMFNIQGDVVWVNAVPNVPVVDWVIGACFLLGVVYGAYRLMRFREYTFFLMFSAVLILLLPSTLAVAFPEENPSVVRAGGVAPFVMLFAALPLMAWRRQFSFLKSRVLGDVLIGLLLITTVWFNYNLYFYRYDLQYRSASWNSTEIAETLRKFAVEHNDWNHIYVMTAPQWVDYRAVGIHLGNYSFDSHLIPDLHTLAVQKNDPAAKVYTLKNDDTTTLTYLKNLYPNGVTQRVQSRTRGRDFIAFYAPARE